MSKNPENNTKANYIQPVFNDELPSWMTPIQASAISTAIIEASAAGFLSGTFKMRVAKALDEYNPMWVIVQESKQGAHRIYELDINGRGTGVYLQILSSVGIFNVFQLP